MTTEAPAGPDGSPAPKRQKTSTLDRLQRLQRLECERLERRDAQHAAREGKLASNAERARIPDSLLERFERRANIPMVILGLAWFVAIVIALTGSVGGTAQIVLVGFCFVAWTIALVEYLVRLILAPSTKHYANTRRVEPVTVAIPALQCMRLYGVDKADLVTTEMLLRVKAIMLHKGLFRVLIAAVGLLFLAAWLIMLAEANAKNSNIHNYGDALWWATVTVTTVGFGDRFPVTILGRVVADVLMFTAIGLIGTLTATVASFFMQEHADRHADAHKEQLKAAHEDLGARMDRLEALLVTATGGTPANTDSTDASLADVTAAPDPNGTLADTTAPASTVLATPAAEADPDRSTP